MEIKKIDSPIFQIWMKWISLLGCVTLLLYFIFNNEVPVDEGDGLQHFAISQLSWKEPLLFLDHWNKPLYTLFSSFFAQFGQRYFPFFTLLCFVGSTIVMFQIFNKLKVHSMYAVIAPILLLTIPDYTFGVLAGMTEPFFGLITLCLLLTILNNKWWLFALIASFTPFARSEGMYIVFLAVLVLLINKQWKIIPILAVGFLIYAIIGKIALDQFWWYFENDPYPATSIYGSGKWTVYIESWKMHLGLLTVVFIPFAFFGWFIWRSRENKLAWTVALFVVGTYVGIIGIHSYLWAYGLKGALGLSRIATQGLPLFCCFLLLLTDFVSREFVRSVQLFFAALFLVGAYSELKELKLPLKANEFQKIIKKVVVQLQHSNLEGRTVYYLHPLISHYMGINQFEKHEIFKQTSIHLKSFDDHYFKTGDLIIRDSHFGPVDQGLRQDEIAKYPWIVPVQRYYVSSNDFELNGEVQSVIIYQVMDKSTFNQTTFFKKYGERKLSVQANSSSFKLSTNAEFAPIIDRLDIPNTIPTIYTLQFSVKKLISESPIYLIFDNGKGVYINKKIVNGRADFLFPIQTETGKFFIHNPDKKQFSFELTLENWRYTPPIGIQPIE